MCACEVSLSLLRNQALETGIAKSVSISVGMTMETIVFLAKIGMPSQGLRFVFKTALRYCIVVSKMQ